MPLAMTRTDHLGRLLDRSTLVWERTLAVDPATLWTAIATREGLRHWFMPTDTEIEEGGRFSFTDGWDGTVTRVEPGTRVDFTPDASDEGYLRFEIEVREGSCLFRLTDRMAPDAEAAKLFGSDTPAVHTHQPGGPGTHWSGVASGYHGFVDALEAYLTGKTIPFDYAALSRAYGELLDGWHA